MVPPTNEASEYPSPPSFSKRELPSFIARRLLWAFGKRRPILAYLKVTRRCNLDCYYCPWHTRADDFEGELSTTAWQGIIDDVTKQGARVLVFEGGEPTLRRDLPDLLDHATARGALTVLATNGHGDIWRFKPRAFTVSIDGRQSLHDAVRGKGSYETIRRNLARRGDRVVVGITVLTVDNCHDIEEMVEEMGPLLDGFLFTFAYQYEAVDVKAIPRTLVAATNQTLLRLKKRYPIMNPASQLAAPPGSWRCHDSATIAVDYRGHLATGCFVQHLENKRCDQCLLGCFQTLASLHEFNLESWFTLYRYVLRRV
jgi:Fe-coproporphyrin III synthase